MQDVPVATKTVSLQKMKLEFPLRNGKDMGRGDLMFIGMLTAPFVGI